MAKLTLPLALGTSRDFPLQAQNLDGSIPTTFLDTDALSATVAIGAGQPSLLAPAIAWIDAPTAQFQVSFYDADTPGVLSRGQYRIQAEATRAGRSSLILDAILEITAVPGTEPVIPVYTTYADLTDHAPWIADLQAPESATWFLRQQGMAREWLDEIIVQRYGVGDTAPMIGTPGFANWSMFAGSIDFAPSKYLRDQLAGNTLIIQPKTREIVACRALFYILRPQLGCVGDTPYRELAADFARRATSMVKTYRAEIDLNHDGWADIIVRCGSTSLR
jgi:hypothetical protein